GQMASLQDPRSKTLLIGYDVTGRVATLTRADLTTELFSTSQGLGLIPPGGLPDGVGLSAANPAIATMLTGVTTTYTNPLGRQYTYAADWGGEGRINESADAFGNYYVYNRDGAGLATVMIDRLSHDTQRVFDANGNVLEIVYPDFAGTDSY